MVEILGFTVERTSGQKEWEEETKDAQSGAKENDYIADDSREAHEHLSTSTPYGFA